MKEDLSGVKILSPTLLLCLGEVKGWEERVDDVILTIDGAASLLDVISAKVISLICHRSLWGETEW